jgi:hypothetical protein
LDKLLQNYNLQILAGSAYIFLFHKQKRLSQQVRRYEYGKAPISRYWPEIFREGIKKKSVIAEINNFKFE